MRRSLLGLVAGSALTLGAIALFGRLYLTNGVTARTEPSRLEGTVARWVRDWTVPASFRKRRNPVPETPAALEEGMRHFADHCASCHANDGSGKTELGQGLYPRAPDMRQAATQRLSDGELFYYIENGIRLTGMPAWNQPGQERASWVLVRFIRHLSALTAQERLEMEKLNPRGPAEWKELEDEEQFLEGADPAPAESPAQAHHHGP